MNEKLNLIKKFNIKINDNKNNPMIFAHGFGCDQSMWRFITPAFKDNYKIILFDLMGAGESDISFYDKKNTHPYLVILKI